MSTKEQSERLGVWRIGVTGGVVGILCCVGPAALALLGIVSASNAFLWATGLYDNDAWWFRLAGLLVLGGLVWATLRRRRMCSVAAVQQMRWRLLGILAVAVVTYLVLYGATTWLGTLA